MRLLRTSILALGLFGLVAGCHTAGVCDSGCDGGGCGNGGGVVSELPGAGAVYGDPVMKGAAPLPKGDQKKINVEAPGGL
jgi:hypothetical protein